MGYWHGSGTLGHTVTREMVCAESNIDSKGCDAVWYEDLETDDWGNIEQTITCIKCNGEWTYTEVYL
jgi:hypothetical protein